MGLGLSDRVLFVGVAGMGMAPLAGWLSERGFEISGYDGTVSRRMLTLLEKAGVRVVDNLIEDDIGEFDVVVRSSAVQSTHPFIAKAEELGLKVCRRGELLAEVCAGMKLIAVAGSHGKTTTTGMVAAGIHQANLPVNYILGGLFEKDSLPPFHSAESEWIVAEVDESDGTIENFTPEISLILNADWDHADHYKDLSALKRAFVDLAHRTKKKVLTSHTCGKIFGSLENCSFYDDTIDESVTDFNSLNEAAALSILQNLKSVQGVARSPNDDWLENFPGIHRRQSVLFRSASLVVMEDYAHHPTEIDRLRCQLKMRYPDHRIVCIFQPHRYSRTRSLGPEFVNSLSDFEECFLLPVYAAFESHDSADFCLDFSRTDKGKPPFINMSLEGARAIHAVAEAKRSLVVFVGAGSITQFAQCYAALVENRWNLETTFTGLLKKTLSDTTIVKEDEPLHNKTTIRIGGRARFFIEPTNRSDLQELIRWSQFFGIPYVVIGRGSNLLVSDEGFPGVVIRLSSSAWHWLRKLPSDRIFVGGGVRLKEICGFAANAGMEGFEFLEGIPGGLGGSLRMNAGAMGSWLFDVVERVQFIDKHGQYQDWAKEQFDVDYRKVRQLSEGIAISAILRSNASVSTEQIRDTISNYSNTRKESQPREASAGCIFKNPEGNGAGRLIDQQNLKGLTIGGAKISEVHANFIVNQGSATCADVKQLVKRIRQKVYEESGILLEPEVLLIGDSWEW